MYESMYADAIVETPLPENVLNCTGPEERKGLLQHSHDDTGAPDILWWQWTFMAEMLKVRMNGSNTRKKRSNDNETRT